MNNALLLKRAMKCLGLSGVALAQLITSYREDGKVTAPETVSRWVSGTNPVEPALLGWLTELVRRKALSLNVAVINWPSKGSMLIAVTNLKGGVGNTTVAQNLAMVAARDYNLRTTHLSVGCRGDFELSRDDLKRQHVTARIVSFDEMLAYQPAPKEVVIADIARDAAYEAMGGDSNAFLRRFEPDLYLIPADFGSMAEANATKKFTELKGLRGLLRLLHRPSFMQLDFSEMAAKSGLPIDNGMFCPYFIPQSKLHHAHIPLKAYDEWQDEEQHYHHINLFSYLVDTLGGEIDLPGDAQRALASMELEPLLDYAEQHAR